MGYACPVCGDPQADAEHLANHLAFTAMLRGGDHEAWLDEHVDDWADRDPPALAERVAAHADEEEYPQVFEDTTDRPSGRGDHAHGEHDHAHGARGHGGDSSPVDAVENAAPGGIADVDAAGDAEDVLAEARELTRQRRENAAGDAGEGDGTPAESEAETADGETDDS